MSNYKIKNSTVEGNAIGSGNNLTNTWTNERGTRNVDNYTTNVSGGVVGTAGRSSGTQNIGQIPARSETQDDSRNQSSTQETENESRSVAREVEEAVEAIYADECEGSRRREKCRSTIDCLKKLGVYNLKDLDLLEEAELEQGGIKLVQARKLKRYCKDHSSAGQVAVKTEPDAKERCIKTEDRANNKRQSTTRQSKASKKRK